MPEQKPPSTPPAEQESAPSRRVPAGESSDPDVHFLIANRRAHELVLEAPDSTEDNKRHAAEAVAEIDKQLKKMGYR